MNKIKIYQIFYSNQTFEALDPGFIPLDNSDGPKDWMEYWAIREYFLNNEVGLNDLIGFFSPRFKEKTGLESSHVFEHINNNPDADIYLFNPYYHLAAWHTNVFLQGEISHPGLIDLTNKLLQQIEIDIDTSKLIMSSLNTVFCNYFVANINFWKDWLSTCEYIFSTSQKEKESGDIALSAKTNYLRGDYEMQIFLIERIASLLLADVKKWRICPKYIYKDMNYAASKNVDLVEILNILDSLKTSFLISKDINFLKTYDYEKNKLITDYNLFIY
jgi:hypothetical protein